MLTKRPIHELSLDEVAAEAGVSRGLLFRYFPTKTDFHKAVVGAAARRLLRATEPDADAAPADQLRQTLDAYVGYLERRGDLYIALVRGAGGGADYMVEIYEHTRDVMTQRLTAALGPIERTPALDLVIRGWFSFVEATSLAWRQEKTISRDELLTLLVKTLSSIVSAVRPDLKPTVDRLNV